MSTIAPAIMPMPRVSVRAPRSSASSRARSCGGQLTRRRRLDHHRRPPPERWRLGPRRAGVRGSPLAGAAVGEPTARGARRPARHRGAATDWAARIGRRPAPRQAPPRLRSRSAVAGRRWRPVGGAARCGCRRRPVPAGASPRGGPRRCHWSRLTTLPGTVGRRQGRRRGHPQPVRCVRGRPLPRLHAVDDDRVVDLADDDAPLLPEQTRDDTDRGWGESVPSNDDLLLAASARRIGTEDRSRTSVSVVVSRCCGDDIFREVGDDQAAGVAALAEDEPPMRLREEPPTRTSRSRTSWRSTNRCRSTSTGSTRSRCRTTRSPRSPGPSCRWRRPCRWQRPCRWRAARESVR